MRDAFVKELDKHRNIKSVPNLHLKEGVLLRSVFIMICLDSSLGKYFKVSFFPIATYQKKYFVFFSMKMKFQLARGFKKFIQGKHCRSLY